jgi:hypothetical protein
MNIRFKIATAAILAFSAVACYGQTNAAKPAVKKHATTTKAKTPPPPSVEEQIQALRHDLENQINSLKNDLANKDAELQKARQSAANAQDAAAKAEAAASAQQQAVTDNAAAVTTLQTTVTDLKGNQASLAATISDEAAAQKKTEASLGPLASSKLKIGATVFTDFSYWSDYDGSTTFIDNQAAPSSTADENYNTFELTRAYVNLFYTPSDTATLRITPDIYRASDGSLTYRLKYGFVDLNKLFANVPYIKNTKITFGQMQEPQVDWEEGLTGHRYTYKMPIDFAGGLSSTYVGVKGRVPVEINGKTYLDTEVGVFTEGSYKAAEVNDTKQFMGRLSYYPLGTKQERTGLGMTIFGNAGYSTTNPSSAAANHYGLDRLILMAHYQTSDKGYLLTGQYDLSHNIKNSNNTQSGYAFEGNARLGNKKSPFHAFGMYQYYEPYSNATNDKATQYSRTVGGIAYKFNKNLDIALGDSNLHYTNKSSGKNDANVVSIFTQYSF